MTVKDFFKQYNIFLKRNPFKPYIIKTWKEKLLCESAKNDDPTPWMNREVLKISYDDVIGIIVKD